MYIRNSYTPIIGVAVVVVYVLASIISSIVVIIIMFTSASPSTATKCYNKTGLRCSREIYFIGCLYLYRTSLTAADIVIMGLQKNLAHAKGNIPWLVCIVVVKIYDALPE